MISRRGQEVETGQMLPLADRGEGFPQSMCTGFKRRLFVLGQLSFDDFFNAASADNTGNA